MRVAFKLNKLSHALISAGSRSAKVSELVRNLELTAFYADEPAAPLALGSFCFLQSLFVFLAVLNTPK